MFEAPGRNAVDFNSTLASYQWFPANPLLYTFITSIYVPGFGTPPTGIPHVTLTAINQAGKQTWSLDTVASPSGTGGVGAVTIKPFRPYVLQPGEGLLLQTNFSIIGLTPTSAYIEFTQQTSKDSN
jgi:hypothetical protein